MQYPLSLCGLHYATRPKGHWVEMPVTIDSWRKALLLMCDLDPMPFVLPAGIRREDVSTIVAIVDIDEDVSRRHYYRMQ
jgi:hypothetical protein